jgi:hypothetical protein
MTDKKRQIRIKVSELEGAALAYWTAKAQCWEERMSVNGVCYWYPESEWVVSYRPDVNWRQAGELLEKFDVDCIRSHVDPLGWYGCVGENSMEEGDTPQKAICRAVVASVYGEEVEDREND